MVIIGLGSIGRKHVKALREQHPGFEIFALRSSRDGVHEDNVMNIYNFSEIPSDTDFFIVANPTILHKATILKLLDFGRPLFIEKPVLHEIDNDTSKLAEIIKTKQIFTYTGCPLRYHPCIQYLKKYIGEKHPRINEVTVYCGSHLPDWRPGRDFRQVYSARPELGGGVHLDLIHEIDYTYFLLGRPNEVRSGFLSKSKLAIEAYDYANYLLVYEHFPVSITLNYFRPAPKRSIEIVFEKVVWYVDLISSTIIDSDENLLFSEPVDQHGLLKKQMTSFLEALRSEKPSPYSFDESIEVLKICLNQVS